MYTGRVEHGPDTDTDGRKVNNSYTDNTMKTIDLSDLNTGSDNDSARYIRFTALESVGNFSPQARSCYMPLQVRIRRGAVWRPFTVGNITSAGTAGCNTLPLSSKCIRKSLPHMDLALIQIAGEIQNQHGDINFNGISDIYDYAYTAFRVDGGTTKTGSVSGKITPQSDKCHRGW